VSQSQADQSKSRAGRPETESVTSTEVLYELANGYMQSVPGTLDYWRDYLAATPSNSRSGSEHRCVRAREIVTTREFGAWEAISP
jgi:hypothetical protein